MKHEKKRSELILPPTPPDGKAVNLSSLAYFPAPFAGELRDRRKPMPEGYPYHYYARRATAAQEYRQPDPKPVKVHVHADMLKMTYTDAAKGLDTGSGPAAGGGKRGTVTGFSRASRKRMFEFMASVRNTGSMLFVTMTFDDTTAINTDEWLLACFEAFRKRFERAYPGYRALWRKEHQDRKSGIMVGTFVPHYHLILFMGSHYEKEEQDGKSAEFEQWGRDVWQEITGTDNPAHLIYGFHCTPVRSRKHAYAYVAKYVGKADFHGHSSGRCWGRIGKFDTSASQIFELSGDEYIALRRLVKRWLKTRAQVPAQDAPPEEVEKWLIRDKKQRKYSRTFARGLPSKGCGVFGLGDTVSDGTQIRECTVFLQFIAEVRRQSKEAAAGSPTRAQLIDRAEKGWYAVASDSI